MTAHPPPVPPDQRPKAGPASSGATDASIVKDARPGQHDRNPAEQGQAGNIKQNTTNKGFQQDR